MRVCSLCCTRFGRLRRWSFAPRVGMDARGACALGILTESFGCAHAQARQWRPALAVAGRLVRSLAVGTAWFRFEFFKALQASINLVNFYFQKWNVYLLLLLPPLCKPIFLYVRRDAFWLRQLTFFVNLVTPEHSSDDLHASSRNDARITDSLFLIPTKDREVISIVISQKYSR